MHVDVHPIENINHAADSPKLLKEMANKRNNNSLPAREMFQANNELSNNMKHPLQKIHTSKQIITRNGESGIVGDQQTITPRIYTNFTGINTKGYHVERNRFK